MTAEPPPTGWEALMSEQEYEQAERDYQSELHTRAHSAAGDLSWMLSTTALPESDVISDAEMDVIGHCLSILLEIVERLDAEDEVAE